MIDWRTHTDITGDGPNTPPEVKTYACGCEYRMASFGSPSIFEHAPGGRWFLCAWHTGFDAACDRFAS
jgi:hypothetical protein